MTEVNNYNLEPSTSPLVSKNYMLRHPYSVAWTFIRCQKIHCHVWARSTWSDEGLESSRTDLHNLETGLLGVFLMKFGTNAVYYVCLIVATSLSRSVKSILDLFVHSISQGPVSSPHAVASQHTFQLDPATSEKFHHEPSPGHEIRFGFALQWKEQVKLN